MKSFTGLPNSIQTTSSIATATDALITNPQNGQGLLYNSTNKKWQNQNLPSAPVTSVFGRTGNVTASEGDYSLNQLSDVQISSPVANQIIKYDGSQFVNSDPTYLEAVLMNSASPIQLSGLSGGSSGLVVNGNTITISMQNSGVTAGTYSSVSVNARGLVTAGTNNYEHTYYKFISTYSNVNPAIANTHYELPFGGAVTLNPLNVGDHLMITSGAAATTINLTGTSFIANWSGAGGVTNPTITINNASVELMCTFNSGQTYYLVTRSYQNVSNSEFTINGIKQSAISNLSNIPNVNLTSVSNGQVLSYDNGNWINSAIPVTSFNSRTGAITPQSGDYGITQLSGVTISSASPGQILKYNGSAWVNTDIFPYYYVTMVAFPQDLQLNKRNLVYFDSSATNFTANLPVTLDEGDIVQVLSFSNGTLGLKLQITATGNYKFMVQNGYVSAANAYITPIGNPENCSVTLQYKTQDGNFNENAWVIIDSNCAWITSDGYKLNTGALSNMIDTTISAPTLGQVLSYDGSKWVNSSLSGSVSSVALSLPSIFSVSGSPITSSGTLTGSLVSQSANTIFASPNGSSGTPTFRALADTDLPNSGVSAGTYTSVTVNSKGVVTAATNPSVVSSFNSRTGAVTPQSGDYGITQLSGVSISSPSSGQALTYNGSAWVNSSLSSAPVSSVFGRTGAVTAATNDYSISQITNSSVLANSGNINITSPLGNCLLTYNLASSKWVNSAYQISISGAATNDVLYYNGGAWVNTPGTNYINFQSNGNLITGVTYYLLQTGSSTSITGAQVIMPRNCDVVGLSIYALSTSTGTWTGTVMKNGAALFLSCTIPSGGSSASVSFINNASQFDRYAVRITSSGLVSSQILAALMYI